MSEPIKILTPRFLLRPLTLADVSERYLSWLGDEAAQRYIEAASVTRGLADLRTYVVQRCDRDEVLFLGIFDRETGLHVGNIKYEPLDVEGGFAVMGILIGDREYRGRGVTPEVLAASGHWLAEHLGIREITLGVHRENGGAVRAYEKVGFVVRDTPHIRSSSPEAVTMVWWPGAPLT